MDEEWSMRGTPPPERSPSVSPVPLLSPKPVATTEEEVKARVKALKHEDHEFQEIHQMQKAALEKVREKMESKATEDDPTGLNRLEFLTKQTEVFAHFMEGHQPVVTGKRGRGRGRGRGAGRGRTRKTEEEEDGELMATAMRDRRRDRLTVQPRCIKNGELRDYQLEGLNWMINLHDCGISGILADEMGLGKTLQTISLLGYLKECRGVCGPHLIIVPKSTMGNWDREFQKWVPGFFKMLRLEGNKDERNRLIREELMTGTYEVVLTSYEICIREKASLNKFPWKYLVIDEAHRIKNENSVLAKVVRILDSQHRLLLTGTPLQNNLHELWALLNFLLPDVFSNSDDFDSWFDPSNGTVQQTVVEKLHGVLKPFLLRRLKVDVEKSLPPKTETKLYIGLSAMQKEWYIRVLSKDAANLNALGGPQRVRLLNVLMQLRKVCNHPYLFQGAEAGPPYTNGPHLWENCGKMILLSKLLPRLKEQGSRVLIFCQMTRLLDILEDFMAIQGYSYFRIDGNTKGELREQQIVDFNTPGSPVFTFLLSTRAGGLGINLYTADIVILFDSDWNPQVDLQAQDRAHRIGQKKPVRVLRFITEGTVEEKIVERAERKLYLDAAVIQQGRLLEKNKALSREELMTMIKFGADQIFRSKDSTVTDEDIDAILKKGEEKTEQLNAKISSDMSHNLLNFSLDTKGDQSIFLYDGDDYRHATQAPAGSFLNLPQRERKRQKPSVVEELRMGDPFAPTQSKGHKKKRETRELKMVRAPVMHDFQFLNVERITELFELENEILMKRRRLEKELKVMREGLGRVERKLARKQAKADKAGLTPATTPSPVDTPSPPPVSGITADNAKLVQQVAELVLEKEVASKEVESTEALLASEQLEFGPVLLEERTSLQAEGFMNWTRRDYRNYINACERHGHKNVSDIMAAMAETCAQPEKEVKRYHKVFWQKIDTLSECKRVKERITKGESRLQRRKDITRNLAIKLKQCKGAPLESLTVQYGSSGPPQVGFTVSHDRFLVVSMQRVGYGNWEGIRQAIRDSFSFRFDMFFRSRTGQEIQRRCDSLIRFIEREVGRSAEEKKAKAEGERKAKEEAATVKRESRKSGRGPVKTEDVAQEASGAPVAAVKEEEEEATKKRPRPEDDDKASETASVAAQPAEATNPSAPDDSMDVVGDKTEEPPKKKIRTD